MNEQIKLLFVQRFKGRVLFNESMSAYTSIGIGGAADVMAFPLDEADLIDVLTFAKSKKYPVFILGLGANLLVRDGGIRGVVINMADGFKDITIDAENLKVKADAGVLLSKLISKCAKKGMSGLEFAEGIPGTVGGAVSMNAGAYGGEMKDVVNGVEILRYEGKKNIKKEFIGSKELNFAYRSADVPKGSVVVSAFFNLEKKEPKDIEGKVSEIRAKRKEGAPVKHKNAGSVFKNPEGESAGKLIDRLGLKGERVGDAMVSEEHANYIVNMGSAKATEVLSLMGTVRDKVFKEFGIVLEPELKVVGEE